jgi:trk system potassium uptake protein TrkH
MLRDLAPILRGIGVLLHVPAAMALVTAPLCMAFGEGYAAAPFLLAAAVGVVPGQALVWSTRGAASPRLDHAMMIAAGSWVLAPVVGAIPIYGIAVLTPSPASSATLAAFAEPLNAFFEAVSGFTGTGLSMAVQPSGLPRSLQWWRSFMEWIGGGGVVLVMLSVLMRGRDAYMLYVSEGREQKIMPSVSSTVRTIWWLYLGLTAVSVALLRVAGEPWWVALNHGMTGFATGGFSVTDGSVAASPFAARIALLPIMLMGAISFRTHYCLLHDRDWKALWRSPADRTLLLLAAAGVALLMVELRFQVGRWWPLDAAFQWISALTTCGFQTVDLAEWNPSTVVALALVMVVGGVGGSTASGLKVDRLVLLVQGIYWRFRGVHTTAHEVSRYRVGGEPKEEEEARSAVEAASVLAALWLAVLVAGSLGLLHVTGPEVPLEDALFEAASAQSNVGLSTGLSAPSLHPAGKWILMALMWLGRLEVIPYFIVIGGLWRMVVRRPVEREVRGR